MSIHRSLAVKGKAGKGHRNVLKRFERVAILEEKEKWTPEKDSVFKLPKIKSIKLKKKKSEKKAEEGEEAAAASTGIAATPVVKVVTSAAKLDAKAKGK